MNSGLSRALQLSATWLRRRWGAMPAGYWLLLAGTALTIYSFQLAGARALTEHEIYVAGVARQMERTGDYLLPRVGDMLWLEKPPLPHWLVVASSEFWGHWDEATARWPSVVAAIAVVLLIAALAARWYGATVGLLTGLIQLSTVYMITYARLAEADMLLCAITTAALVLFARLQPDLNGSPRSFARLGGMVFWMLLGLTNLAKGPLFGAMIVLAVVAAWLVWRRDGRGAWSLVSPGGWLLAVAIALAWPAAAAWREPAAWDLWSDHLFGRATGAVNFNNEPLWYYLTCWPWQLLPWTPLLLVAAVPAWRNALADRNAPERFLGCWALVPLVLLSLSKGKHHHYLIYALPALAPLMARGLVTFGESVVERGALALHWGNLCLRFFAPGAVIAAAVLAWRVPVYRIDGFVLGSAMLALFVVVGILTRRAWPRAAIGMTFAGVMLLEMYVHGWVMPRRDSSAADRDFLQAISTTVPADARLVAYGGGEISRHLFYVDRPLEGHQTLQALTPRPHETELYILARAHAAAELAKLGRVEQLAQSRFTRREASADDRYTLFRVEPSTLAAHPAGHPPAR